MPCPAGAVWRRALYTINGLAPSKGDNVVLRWNEELLQSIRANPAGTGPTVTARAIGVVHTSMFDAWAAYDARAGCTWPPAAPRVRVRPLDLQRRRARVLSMFTGSDSFGASVTVKAGASRIEPRTATQPGTPAKDVTLEWPTYSAAADEAGWSRRYGGIHFESGDLHGRALGRAVGWDVWFKARSYIDPFSTGPL